MCRRKLFPVKPVKKLSAVLLSSLILAACGGDSSSADTKNQSSVPAAGRYTLELMTNNAVYDVGTLLVTSGGFALFASYSNVGSGQWIPGASSASIDLLMYRRHGLIDLGASHSPGAGLPLEPNQNLYLTMQQSQSLWSGSGNRLTLAASQATPPIVSLAGVWRYNDIIPFCRTGGACNVAYSANLTLSNAGGISGTDTNGCIFQGTLQVPNNGMYPLSISTNNCVSTNNFIANTTFEGFAYFESATNAQPDFLNLAGINIGQSNGLVLTLARQ